MKKSAVIAFCMREGSAQAVAQELTEHPGYAKHEPVANAAGNTRNGRSRKTLKGEFGDPVEALTPRRWCHFRLLTHGPINHLRA